ncbi:MAG: PAS domain S-box protein [Rhodocyclales bacterium]|nr:PAS domain S-box protein [Rhodocyclales bacterium]
MAPITAIKESRKGGNAPAQNLADQEYLTIIQASLDGFWKVAADGRLIDCNEAACAMLGYRREELLALAIRDIEMREDDEEVAAHMRLVIARGHDRFETEHRCKDGSGILVEVSAYCVPGAEAPLLLVFCRDIGERRQAETTLGEMQQFKQAILDAVTAQVAVVDRHGVIVEVNAAFCAMMGYAAEELVGRSARMLYPSDAEFERAGQEKYGQISGEGIGRIESRLLTRDGRIIDVALSSAPIVPGNLARGITFTVEDITARKQSERQRLAHEARQRDTLIREVHHRIKNHLQGVLGLMTNSIARHPEMAEAMEAIFTRVNAIAKVYGLQGRKPDAHVRFCDLMETLLEGTPGAPPILLRNLSMDMEAILSPQEGVPMALVINELITNADKHRRAKDVGRPVLAIFRIDSDRVTLTVTNAPASLPDGFDLAAGTGINTGLGLLKALLPRTGASLNYRQEGNAVVAELVLVAPLVNCRARRPDPPED